MVTTSLGEQLGAYANAPILVIQRRDDQSSILAFDEDPGDGGDDGASLYVANIGGSPEIDNFSETFSIFNIEVSSVPVSHHSSLIVHISS